MTVSEVGQHSQIHNGEQHVEIRCSRSKKLDFGYRLPPKLWDMRCQKMGDTISVRGTEKGFANFFGQLAIYTGA